MHVRVLCTQALTQRPASSALQNDNVLAASYADGSVRQWHATTGQQLGRTITDRGDTSHVAYSSDGLVLATVGADPALNLYDVASARLAASLVDGTRDCTTGHSSRVFCVAWNPHHRTVLATGGWDDTVQLWDTRVARSIKSIFGPHVCGDSLDFDSTGSFLLTGSYSPTRPLQVSYI